MKRLTAILAAACFAALALASAAQADFGIHDFDLRFTDAEGAPATQAGSHPFALETFFQTNLEEVAPTQFEVEGGDLKDLVIKMPRGFIGDTTAVPRCSLLEFALDSCRDDTAVGITAAFLQKPGEALPAAIYNLTPPPGVPLRLGFHVEHVPLIIDTAIQQTPDYNVTASVLNIPQPLTVYGSAVQIWGVPADPAHDFVRGACSQLAFSNPREIIVDGHLNPQPSGQECSAGKGAPKPFLTLPRSCEGPLATDYQADSWSAPGAWVGASLPQSPFLGCGSLGFDPSITAQPTTKAATSPTGLDFSLDVEDEGLKVADRLAQSDIRKTVVTLPEGMSVNPSQAEGLEVCTEADLEAEALNAEPGEGCPQASKIGTVEVESPLVEEAIKGGLFVAEPYHNLAGNSLIAVYLVIKNPKLGVIVKQPLRVESDPVTGRLTTVADDIPQLPFSHFKLHFREGARSPLVSPPSCGSHVVKAVLYPWSGGAPVETTSAFQIISGPDNSPCPSGGVPPFHPGLDAGTINNAAGKYSPFNLRLFRSDSEQEITHFSIKLPPGLVGKLAGIPYCSDAAIEAAKARTGPLGGHEELAAPSCPAASEVGRTLAGAGVGSALTYAPGKIYLAGPYHGSALSIVAITAGVVGPFDIGTVVVRQALKINPETAEVFIDATGSDPIPHIIKGIPVHLRDIRAYVDKPEFVLNPTNCTRTSTASTVLGSGLNFGSEADDQPITVTSPFQAADCASLGFAPKLALSLKGGTRRGAHPAFKAVLTYPKGSYANIAAAQVTLPHSEFLENAHIKTICTRVQFNEGKVPGEKCPPGSIYGFAKAVTPILSDPLEGPVFLRSSSHRLPDLVAALHNGQIDIVVDGHVDSVKGGRIRNTFEAVPDAPVTSFTLEMKGGAKGLLVNSTNLCAKVNKAIAHFTGQNGKVHDFNPVLKPDCGKGKGGKGRSKPGPR